MSITREAGIRKEDENVTWTATGCCVPWARSSNITARQTIEIDMIEVKLTNCVTRFILMLNILVRKVTSPYMGYTYIPYLTKHRSYQAISQSFIYVY